MKKILALTALTAGLFAGQASALTVTYDSTTNPTAAFGAGYTYSTTNWGHMLSLPGFNIAGATLNSATLSYEGGFQSSGRIDSEDAASTSVIFRSGADLDFYGNGANGSSNVGFSDVGNISLLRTLFNGTLAADDEAGAGNADYLGADSASGLSNSAATSVFTALLTGVTSSPLNIWAVATGSSSTSGSGNISSDIITEARARISVTYDYTLNPPVTVPEPASLAILGMGFAAMGFAARKRKSA